MASHLGSTQSVPINYDFLSLTHSIPGTWASSVLHEHSLIPASGPLQWPFLLGLGRWGKEIESGYVLEVVATELANGLGG